MSIISKNTLNESICWFQSRQMRSRWGPPSYNESLFKRHVSLLPVLLLWLPSTLRVRAR